MVNKRSSTEPPKLADRFFSWFCDESEFEILKGDLQELFQDRLQNKPFWIVSLLYYKDVLDVCRPFAWKALSATKFTNIDMFRNYFKVTYRNFFRQKAYSFINISGLAIGLSCFVLIFLYIQDELSYDQFHDKSERTYRVLEHFEDDGQGEHSASQPFPVGPALITDFGGQIEHQVRLFNFQSPTLALANKEAERAFNESKLFFADSTLFDVFDFELLQGNKATALDDPNSILLTASMAKKYFQDEDPMGQLLELQGFQNLKVTGVLADAPTNAHFTFDFFVSFSSLKQHYNGGYPRTWYWNPCWTYIVLRPGTDRATMESQFPSFVDKYFPDFVKDDIELELQPLTDIHLHSKLDYEIEANSDISNVYIFSAVAFFVLLIASINFINLSTARANKRAKEVGVRKSLGSGKGQLINQFIFESVALTLLAAVIGLIVVGVSLPYFNSLTEKSLTLLTLLNPLFFSGLLLLILMVGLLSGFYPAFILSSFNTILVLKNAYMKSTGLNFRKILVTVQFAISIMLIIGTIIAVNQLQFLQNDDIGFDDDNLLMIPVIRSNMNQHYESFRTLSLQNPHVKSMTAVEEIVGAKHQVNNYQFEGMDNSKPFHHFHVRHNFTETFDIPIVAGRDYMREIQTDDSLAMVVNEKMVRAMNWGSPEEAIGQRFYFRGQLKGKVVGVVKDYNFVSKHHPISPFILTLNSQPWAFNLFIKYVAVKVDGNHLQEAIAGLEESWRQFLPNRPFDYFFLDDRLADSYKAEKKLSKVTIIFSILAVIVACLGLFGLATFSVEQRTKEIGVRKVLGISTPQIFGLLSKEFVYLILIAFVVSCPLTYLMLDQWLNGFAYRVNIEIWPFLIAGFITFMVAFFTIVYHAMRASLINPTETLKYE